MISLIATLLLAASVETTPRSAPSKVDPDLAALMADAMAGTWHSTYVDFIGPGLLDPETRRIPEKLSEEDQRRLRELAGDVVREHYGAATCRPGIEDMLAKHLSLEEQRSLLAFLRTRAGRRW